MHRTARPISFDGFHTLPTMSKILLKRWAHVAQVEEIICMQAEIPQGGNLNVATSNYPIQA